MGEPTELHLERVHPTVRRLRVRIAEGPGSRSRPGTLRRARRRRHVARERADADRSDRQPLPPRAALRRRRAREGSRQPQRDVRRRRARQRGDGARSARASASGARCWSLLRRDASRRPTRRCRRPTCPALVAASPTMQEIGRTVERLAQSNVSVLIQGETGTGKELVARAIHDLSARAKRPFIVVDLRRAAGDADRVAAVRSRAWRVHRRRAAPGGRVRARRTAERSFSTRSASCRWRCSPRCCGVLERRSFRRLGGKEDIQVDVRVISATHRDLRAEANRARSAPICTSGSRSRASRSRRCASGPRTSIRWSRTSPPRSRGAPGFLFSEATMTRCAGIAGPATCASCATSSRARSRWASINLNGLAQPAPPARERGGDPAVPRRARRGAGGVRAQLPAPADRGDGRQRVRGRARGEHGPPVSAVAAAPSRPPLIAPRRAACGRPRRAPLSEANRRAPRVSGSSRFLLTVRARQGSADICRAKRRGPRRQGWLTQRRTAQSSPRRASGIPESVVGERQQGTASQPTSRRRDRWLRTTLIAARGVRGGRRCRRAPARATDAKKIFNQRCTACHTFGKGVKVGPDLKGVTARRQRPWLLKFVRSSQKVIAGGDPIATELFRTFKRQRMPDWTDLSPAGRERRSSTGSPPTAPSRSPPTNATPSWPPPPTSTRARALFEGRDAARRRRARLRRLPHRARPRPARRRHAGSRPDRHVSHGTAIAR